MGSVRLQGGAQVGTPSVLGWGVQASEGLEAPSLTLSVLMPELRGTKGRSSASSSQMESCRRPGSFWKGM